MRTLVKQNEHANNNNKEDTTRQIVSSLRQNEEAYEIWYTALQYKYPFLDIGFHNAQLLLASLITKRSNNRARLTNFWRLLFEHMLKIFFIHPRALANDQNISDAIFLIEEGWNNFLAVHVKLDFETSELTSKKLQRLHTQYEQTRDSRISQTPLPGTHSQSDPDPDPDHGHDHDHDDHDDSEHPGSKQTLSVKIS